MSHTRPTVRTKNDLVANIMVNVSFNAATNTIKKVHVLGYAHSAELAYTFGNAPAAQRRETYCKLLAARAMLSGHAGPRSRWLGCLVWFIRTMIQAVQNQTGALSVFATLAAPSKLVGVGVEANDQRNLLHFSIADTPVFQPI